MNIGKLNWKQQTLPLARIKKIMKYDEAIMAEIERERDLLLVSQQHEASAAALSSSSSGGSQLQPLLSTAQSSINQRFMIAGEAPVILSKACELMVKELSVRAWRHTEKNRRRTLQKQDIHAAVAESDVFDFLIDIVPRVALHPPPATTTSTVPGEMQSVAYNMMDQQPPTTHSMASTAASHTPAASDFHQIQYTMMMQQQQQQLQDQNHGQGGDAMPAQDLQQQQQPHHQQQQHQQHPMMMYMPQMHGHLSQAQASTTTIQSQQDHQNLQLSEHDFSHLLQQQHQLQQQGHQQGHHDMRSSSSSTPTAPTGETGQNQMDNGSGHS